MCACVPTIRSWPQTQFIKTIMKMQRRLDEGSIHTWRLLYCLLTFPFRLSNNTESAAAAAQPGGPTTTLQSRVRPLSDSRVRLKNHNPLLYTSHFSAGWSWKKGLDKPHQMVNCSVLCSDDAFVSFQSSGKSSCMNCALSSCYTYVKGLKHEWDRFPTNPI